MAESPLAVVIGALNLDVIVQGLPKFAGPDEQVNGTAVSLAPGGKGRNIASMLAAWLEPQQVSMFGKLVKDAYDLHRIPLESLIKAGINIDSVFIEPERPKTLPTLAIFLNTKDQQRASYYLPGDNETLTMAEIDRVKPLLKKLGENHGFLLLTLEMPLETACHALSLAADLGVQVMLDAGGQPPQRPVDFSPLFDLPIYVLKPNASEAERLTNCPVTDFKSAQTAASILTDKGVEHILITHGAHGAYAFDGAEGCHLPAPNLPLTPGAESTGCGDQVLAVLCAEMLGGKGIFDASRTAVTAGSLQYLQPGLTPIQPDHPQLFASH